MEFVLSAMVGEYVCCVFNGKLMGREHNDETVSFVSFLFAFPLLSRRCDERFIWKGREFKLRKIVGRDGRSMKSTFLINISREISKRIGFDENCKGFN